MSATPSGATAALRSVLGDAKALNFLGPPSLDSHISNGMAFVRVIERAGATTVLDLGSGGGAPALVVATALPGLQAVLIERSVSRADFLLHACGQLQLHDRVRVVADDAVTRARDADLQGWADVVTARSFGPPAVTAECAVRYLRPEGWLIVSEPPDSRDASARWPAEGLALLGLELSERFSGAGVTLQTLIRCGALHDRYPRRSATVRKRPAF